MPAPCRAFAAYAHSLRSLRYSTTRHCATPARFMRRYRNTLTHRSRGPWTRSTGLPRARGHRPVVPAAAVPVASPRAGSRHESR